MRTREIALIAAVGMAGWLAIVPASQAKAGDVIRQGSCSAGSSWKLKLSPQNGAIEVEYEVDQNVVGATWRVKIFQNGVRIFVGNRKTVAPSGSFSVRLVAPNSPGTDAFRGAARNLATDETCGGRASI